MALITLLLLGSAAAHESATGEGARDVNKMGDSMLQSETQLAKDNLAAEEAPGSEDDEAEVSKLSLLLGSEQESHSTASILEMVQSLAEQDARGKLHSVNLTESIIQKIIQQMEEGVIKAADTQHKRDQSVVNRMLEDVKKCKETMEDKFNAPTNGVKALKQSTETAKSKLTTCKTDLVGKITTKETECTAFTSFVKGLSNSKPKCVCTLAETPSPEVLACIQEAKSWGTSSEASYIDLRDKCDTATGAVATKEKACNTAQGIFESSFCSYGEKLTDTCQDYGKCHSDTSAAYNDNNGKLKVAETSRKAEFVAAQKVICFVGVLKVKAAEKQHSLKECLKKTFSTSHLDMSYPGLPVAAVCDVSPVANMPCDEAFITDHYEASWSKKAPAATCVPCAWSKASFVVGERGSSTCPSGSESITSESKCQAAAKALGKAWSSAGSWHTSPKGCLTSEWDGRGVYYNQHSTGQSHAHQAPICKEAAACIDGDVKVEGNNVVAGSAYQPYVFYQSAWYPICGHWFWNNNNGATAVCKKLGFAEGTVTRDESTSFQTEAMQIGMCRSGEQIIGCTGGCNEWGVLPASCISCSPGTGIGVKVTCHGSGQPRVHSCQATR